MSAGVASYARGTAATCATCGSVGHRTERCVAHLLPQVIVSLPSVKKHRFEQHCDRWRREAEETNDTTSEWRPGQGLAVLPSQREPELVFLRSPTPARVVQFIHHSSLLNRHFDALFVSQFVEPTLEGVMERAARFADDWQLRAQTAATSSAGDSDSQRCVFRLQSFPKSLRADLLGRLPASVAMHPRVFTHTLFVVSTYNKYFVGIESGDLLTATTDAADDAQQQPTAAKHDINKDDVLSRAYHKLDEAFLVDTALAKRITPGCRAIDIGSSPGGWSAFLASKGCHVLSIDPGAVHCTSPLVRHVPKLVEHALEEIQSFATPTTPMDLIVCDMNVRPEEAVKLIRLVCESAAVSPAASIVLTCKETLVGRSKKLVQDAMIGLSDFFGSYRSYHLLANGKERTLVGEFLTITDAERESIRAARTAEQAARAAAWEATLAEKKRQEAIARDQPTEADSKKKQRRAKKSQAQANTSNGAAQVTHVNSTPTLTSA